MANNLGYILKQDVLAVIDAGTLDELTGGKKAIGSNPAEPGFDSVWRVNEPTSLEKVNGYCRHWYDMDVETRPIFEYDVAEANILGQRVAGPVVDESRKLYDCIQDAPAGTLLTDIAFFTENDDRNPVLVEATATLIVYTTSKRQNPRQLPEQRNIDYDNVMKTLRDIQTGKIQLNIAQREDVEDDDPGHQVAFGGFDNVSAQDY